MLGASGACDRARCEEPPAAITSAIAPAVPSERASAANQRRKESYAGTLRQRLHDVLLESRPPLQALVIGFHTRQPRPIHVKGIPAINVDPDADITHREPVARNPLAITEALLEHLELLRGRFCTGFDLGHVALIGGRRAQPPAQ